MSPPPKPHDCSYHLPPPHPPPFSPRLHDPGDFQKLLSASSRHSVAGWALPSGIVLVQENNRCGKEALVVLL